MNKIKWHIGILYVLCLFLTTKSLINTLKPVQVPKELVLKSYNDDVVLTSDDLKILVRIVKEKGFSAEELKLLYSLKYQPRAVSNIQEDVAEVEAMKKLLSRNLVYQDEGLLKTTHNGEIFLKP